MSIKRLIGLIAVYILTCVAWLALAAVNEARTSKQSHSLRAQVSSLWGWGAPQAQQAPQLQFRAVTPSEVSASGSVVISEQEAALLKLQFPKPEPEHETKDQKNTAQKRPAQKKPKQEAGAEEEKPRLWVLRSDALPVVVNASTIEASLRSDPRRKGLVWYALYDVGFDGKYVYQHAREEAGYLDIELALPTLSALYDALVFEVDGQDRRAALDPATGRFKVSIPVVPGQRVNFSAAYTSRGSDSWSYAPSNGVQQLENFHFNLLTNFTDIDFPEMTLAPSDKDRTGDGWKLTWDLKSTVTGHGMGMVLPQHIQPGELSTALTLSAPVSLLFFFVMLFMLATLRKLDIHPVNYLFLAAAFFAFHLLFSYSADHLTVPWAFALSSVVSLVLVVSYLRLVVSPKFALREAALGQLVYLIGFSLAHFWEGMTGLTITVMAIITLFLLMQATGRLRWSEVLARTPSPPKPPAYGPQPAYGARLP